MSDITMPALSPTMETGALVKWHVGVGDEISSGDVIAEIETDKATMEVEAIDDGTITEIVVAEGTENVPVNSVIARFRAEGETDAPVPAAPAEKPAAAPKPEAAAPAVAVTAAQPAVAPAPAAPAKAAAPVPASAHGPRLKASPLARRLARQYGVDLAALKGSGPHGRIVKADVEAAAQSAPAPAPAVAPAAAPASTATAPYESVALSAMRKTIARRLTQSKQEIPHYYLTIDTRLDALLALRKQLNKALEAQRLRLSVNDFIIKALALALRRVPDANVSFMGDHLRRYARADISVAVALPAGLITPVIRNADGLRLSEISATMRELGGRAKEGRLKPEEYTGGTASISNLGMFGIREFSAVINPPEGLILAIGAAEKRAIVSDDAVAIATMMSVTGSFDHRAIDGAVGAKLLGAFRDLIENPLAMLA